MLSVITGKDMNKCARDMHFYTYKPSDMALARQRILHKRRIKQNQQFSNKTVKLLWIARLSFV